MNPNDIAKRFVAGTASGVCLVLVGHPWDSLKVKMQVEKEANVSLRETIRRTFRQSGIKGFYYGMTPPLALTGVINTVLWGMQFNLVEYLSPGKPATTGVVMQAAVISGILISAIVTPVEVIKSKLQVGKGDKGPLRITQEIYQNSGIRGIYRGLSAVALVRASNWAYFGSYAAIQDFLQTLSWAPKSRQGNALLAGGLAGVCFWFAAFGFDTVKARMMVDETPKSFVRTAQDIYREHGLRGFTRGFSPCVIRAFPANAAAFFGFETAMALLNKLETQKI